MEKPERSLGVITANVDHQERIEAALRRASIENPSLAEFQQRMAGPRRRLFVKSLESVQGDERDVIVLRLSIGRAKGSDGRLRRYFGPINQEGGERRLNVAVSRARTFLHVVSAFTPDEIQPESRRSGPEMLRRFLHVAATGAAPRHVGRAEDVELNPIERDLLAELHRRHIPAFAQWGVGRYRIDSLLPIRTGRDASSSHSNWTATRTTTSRACGTVIDCARSTWSGWDGFSIACGRARGSPIVPPRPTASNSAGARR